MVERFFPRNRSKSGRYEHEEGDELEPIIMLSGPPSCGKMSLLFQYALNRVEKTKGVVVFICNRRRFEAEIEIEGIDGIEIGNPLLSCIEMKYVENAECLKKYMSGFHLIRPIPVAVIIHDFANLFLQQIIPLLALSRSAILHANETATSTSTSTSPSTTRWGCQLLLSDTLPTPPLSYLYKRWISSVFTIQQPISASANQSSFTLNSTTLGTGSATPKATTTATYSISTNTLHLLEITQHQQQQQQ